MTGMLAYLFWHRPDERADAASYEDAQRAFHHSLERRPPEGYCGSACYRAAELPWLADGGAGYEDWYVVEDWTALGILRQAAAAAGHRSLHDAAARHAGPGAGGVYRLSEGGARLNDARQAIWVDAARGSDEAGIAPLLLGDGLDRNHAGLWRRELTLGPAPEYCLLVAEPPAGVGEGRMPADWHSQSFARDLLWASERLL